MSPRDEDDTRIAAAEHRRDHGQADDDDRGENANDAWIYGDRR